MRPAGGVGLLVLVVWCVLVRLEPILAARDARRQYQRRRQSGRPMMEAAHLLGQYGAPPPRGYWQYALARKMSEDPSWQRPRVTSSNDH